MILTLILHTTKDIKSDDINNLVLRGVIAPHCIFISQQAFK